jgi:SAM-dependent methyltransferase
MGGFVSSTKQVSRLLRHPVAGGRAAARRVQADSLARHIRRVTTSHPHHDAGQADLSENRPPCLICDSPNTRVRHIRRPKRSHEIRICQECRFVSNAGNTVDYTKFKSVKRFQLTARVGTEERPGREYHMAAVGADILGREGLQVLVFGAGRSVDYQHIATLPNVERVTVSDVVDLHGEADFINITKGTSLRFDLIIACEVVEHFTDPRMEFPRLFDLLTENGLLVCSTDIYDGGDVAEQDYLYLRGHASYYSPRAIAEIARRSGMLFDFRLPAIGLSFPGARKRYILFTRNVTDLQKVAEHFGSHPFAPAEARDPLIDLRTPWHQLRAAGRKRRNNLHP